MYGSAFAQKASSTLALTLHCSATFFQHECVVTKWWQKWSLKWIGWGVYANTHGLPFNLVSQEGHAPVLTRWPLFHTTPVSLGNGFQSLRFTPPPPNPQSWQILSSQKRSDFWKEPNIIWIPGWWIRWRLKPRNTIFGQIQGMRLRASADCLWRLRRWLWSEFQGSCRNSFTRGNVQPRQGTVSSSCVSRKV